MAVVADNSTDDDGYQLVYGIPAAPPKISVIGEGFCVPYPIDLVVKKKLKRFIFGSCFKVFDVQGNLLFQVDHGNPWTFQRKMVMRDASGFPIITFREKVTLANKHSVEMVLASPSRPEKSEVMSWLHEWKVHGGDHTSSSPDNHLLLTVQNTSPLQLRMHLDVFLATNFAKAACDFHVVGCYSSHSTRIYKGDTVIAKVNHNFTWQSLLEGKETFKVSVYPEVDYAFIVALIVIFTCNFS